MLFIHIDSRWIAMLHSVAQSSPAWAMHIDIAGLGSAMLSIQLNSIFKRLVVVVLQYVQKVIEICY